MMRAILLLALAAIAGCRPAMADDEYLGGQEKARAACLCAYSALTSPAATPVPPAPNPDPGSQADVHQSAKCTSVYARPAGVPQCANGRCTAPPRRSAPKVKRSAAKPKRPAPKVKRSTGSCADGRCGPGAASWGRIRLFRRRG